MEKPVIIFGANSIGKAALEIFQSNQVVVYGFLDDDQEKHGKEIGSIPVLGNPDDHGFIKLIGQKCEAFVASDDNALRKQQVEMLTESRKVMPTNAIHQTANISSTASIGHGNFINAKAFIGAEGRLGHHNIIHSGVIIESETTVGDFVQIGTGSNISAGVTIKSGVFLGSGVTVVAGVTIEEGARIGAGSVVVGSIEKGATVFGNPAVPIEGK